jgi:tetratricopeptide (TPR) repeat protein
LWRALGGATLAVVATLLTAGCAMHDPRPVSPAAVDPAATESAIREAADLVAAGCLDCLVDAHQLLTRLPKSPETARAAIDTAVLIAIRERELGLADGGDAAFVAAALGRADDADEPDAPVDPSGRDYRMLLDVVETLPGAAGQMSAEADFVRRSTALRRRDEFIAFLQPHADESALFAYVWVSFNCAYRVGDDQAIAARLAVPHWRETALLTYRAATCRGIDEPAVRRLLAANPRFSELRYVTGLVAAMAGRGDELIDEWTQAYAWRSRWPTLTQALADQYVSLEEYERALDFFDRTLALVPQLASAMLGRAKVLTYLERYEESLTVVDDLLALNGWYVGDARYWRALNLTQLERYDAAWEEIERAAALVANADVPKLAGIIAYRRGQRDVARTRFEEARRRNPADCETGLHLSIVLSDLRVWSDASAALAATMTCLTDEALQIAKEVERIQSSSDRSTRAAKQLADRQERLTRNDRLQKTVWFNAAVASFYSARMDEARQFATRVVDDGEFGGRARALIARIP